MANDVVLTAGAVRLSPGCAALPMATRGPTRAPNCTLHNGAMRNDTTALEGAVDLVVLPVTFGLRAGNLRLADGRLTFTRRRGRVVFDAPVHELHSVARSSLGTGFHLWHGPTRYRFVVHHPVLPSEYGPGGLASTVEAVDQLRRGVVTTARSRAEVDRWHDALSPVIAPAPPVGIDVHPPWSPWRFVVGMLAGSIAATLVLVAAIAAVVVAAG